MARIASEWLPKGWGVWTKRHGGHLIYTQGPRARRVDGLLSRSVGRGRIAFRHVRQVFKQDQTEGEGALSHSGA